MAKLWLIHGTLCLSQVILVIHSFVVKHSLDSTYTSNTNTTTFTNTTTPPTTTTLLHPLHPPLLFAALRSTISAPILLALYYTQLNNSNDSATFTSIPPTSHKVYHKYLYAASCGFFGVYLYPLLYALGLRSTTPTAACVCEALTPIFSLGLESLWSPRATASSSSNNKTKTKTLAVFLAVVGSIVMTIHGVWVDASGDAAVVGRQVVGRTTGNIYVIASAAAYALFLSVQRRTLQVSGASVMFLTSWGNVFGCLLLMSTAYVVGALNVAEMLHQYKPFFFYGMVWAALVTSVLGYTLEGLANSWSSPTLVAIYNAVQPFGAGLLSHGVAGGKHAASGVELGAAVLVCSGVLLLKTDDEGKELELGVLMKKDQRRLHLV